MLSVIISVLNANFINKNDTSTPYANVLLKRERENKEKRGCDKKRH